MKLFFTILLLLPLCNFVQGQIITGLVSFEDSYLPANNVNVSVEGSRTYTDSIGNYSIQISSSTEKIYFNSSLIYYDPLAIDIKDVKNDTVINVTLKMNIPVLEELVVIAKVIPGKKNLSASRMEKKSRGFLRKKQFTFIIDSVGEDRKPELINIEKRWALKDENSLSFWTKIIYENITYPDKMWEYGVSGRVLAKFKIDINGNLSDLEIIKGLDPEIDKEVLRVLELMPSWSEYYEYYCSLVGGRNFNQLVSQRGAINYFGIFVLPIVFKIEYSKNENNGT